MVLEARQGRRPSGAWRAVLVLFAALVLPLTPGFRAQEIPGVKAPAGANEAEASPPDDPQGEIRSLKEELAALRKRIEDLQASAGAPAGTPGEPAITLKTAPAGSRRRTVGVLSAQLKPLVRTHDNEVEVWDPTGKALIWKSEMDGHVDRFQVEPDGKRLTLSMPGKTVVLELATGKVIRESRPAPGGGAPEAANRLLLSAAPRRAGDALGLAATRLDVVQLAEGLIAAQGEMRVARAKLERLRGSPEDEPAEVLKVQMDTAASRLDLLQRMGRSALKSTTTEIERLREIEGMTQVRFHAGQVTAEDFAAMRSRLSQAEMVQQLLEDILGSSVGKRQ